MESPLPSGVKKAEQKMSSSGTFSRAKFESSVDAVSQSSSIAGSALERFFVPRSVAVVGATDRPGSVGRNILANLLTENFPGKVYPVNLKKRTLLGVRAYAKLEDCPEIPDLVVLITPAKTIPALVEKCVLLKVPGIITISAGFREVGPEGAALERKIAEILQSARGRTRLLGPNCIGMMNPGANLNATFCSQMCDDGGIALVSQSGAMLSSILDWALKNHIGFSYMVSVGSMVDLNWADLLDYLGDCPRTKAIAIYMETIGDARSFLSAAREISLVKPVLVLKTGKSSEAAAAAVSHTGSLAGSDLVLDEAFRRAGVVRVDRVQDLFELPKCLSQPVPQGPKLCIVTNAGGPGVLATDALIEAGCQLAKLSPEEIEELSAVLPKEWSHGNPVDVLGSASAELFSNALEVVRRTNCDGVLIIAVPLASISPVNLATVIKATAANERGKPFLVCYQGGTEMDPGRLILDRGGIPTFEFADDACRMFAYMFKYQRNLELMYELPQIISGEENTLAAERARQEAVRATVEKCYESGRTVMTEEESKRVLAAYDIPVVKTLIAATAEKAVECAKSMGYPVVLKIHSETITHKTQHTAHSTHNTQHTAHTTDST